jgi:3',5'-cyclic AMP phosphodiesterase CpdA
VRLLAISDLHLRHAATREALARLAPHPRDWLIVAGDVGETEAHLRYAWSLLRPRFARLLWVPGNHELWTLPSENGGAALRGEARYRRFVEVCREYDVWTPEDPYPEWPGPGPRCRVAPLFNLYDYSYRPPEVAAEDAVEWAVESGVLCADESLLHPDPWPDRAAWCAERIRVSEERLARAAEGSPLVLVAHWPLREDVLTVRRVPRFSIWCGSRATEDWHLRYRAVAVVYGHLHVRRRVWRDGVRFEEVSLGYPRDWDTEQGIEPYLRQILPEPEELQEGFLP